MWHLFTKFLSGRRKEYFTGPQGSIPDHTAIRVALWRALHVHLDHPPFVFNDLFGEKLIADPDWRQRPDMDPQFSKSMRASIVGRARFVEDLLEKKINNGVEQYIILGAGLDSFSIRRSDLLNKIKVFEVDQKETQDWKKDRILKIGHELSNNVFFVPVDFESTSDWTKELIKYGFDLAKPAFVVSTGVSMYLEAQANVELLQRVSRLAEGSCFVMTFMLSLDLLIGKEKEVMQFVMNRASESGTPFKSLYSPEQIIEMANTVGFNNASVTMGNQIYDLYFSHRSDHLNPGNAEAFLVAEK